MLGVLISASGMFLAAKICICLFVIFELFGVITFPAFLLCKAMLGVLISASCIEEPMSHAYKECRRAHQAAVCSEYIVSVPNKGLVIATSGMHTWALQSP